MKTQFVTTLQEGDTVNDCFVAVRKDLRDQSSGGKFLGMVFKDRTGEVGGILWNNAAAIARMFEIGDVVNVRGSVTTYQGRLQIRVDQVLPLNEDEYKAEDMVAAPGGTEEHIAELKAILDTVEDEWLRQLKDSFLNDEAFMERFATAAAGKKWHHAYRGGLARHSLEVARIASTVCELFPEIDRDLLLTAVFAHDVGKLDELSQGLMVDYTTPGKLLGHLQMGVEMVNARIAAIDGFPEQLRLHLIHCILAHHGELANASPVVPKTLEAMVLFQCDNLDAQADALNRVTEETAQKGLAWSEFIPLIDRPIWTKRD